MRSTDQHYEPEWAYAKESQAILAKISEVNGTSDIDLKIKLIGRIFTYMMKNCQNLLAEYAGTRKTILKKCHEFINHPEASPISNILQAFYVFLENIKLLENYKE